MKKLLGFALWLLAVPSWAQFVPGQVLTAAQLNSQFALYAPLAGATFSGAVVLNGAVSGTGITTLLGPYLLASTAASTYAPQNNPTFTGTVTVPNNSFALTKLATQAANTMVANVTAGVAAPTAASLPSCSTANSALQYTSGSGLTCSTNTAIITGTTFTGASGLSYSAPNFTINDTAGTNRTAITYSSNGTVVWDEGFAAASPHNYSVCRYTAGVFTDCPISISQANGSMTFVGGIASSPIGATGASTGAFTTLSASSTVSGTGFSTYLASPPAIGGTTPAAGAFTTLSATGAITPSQTAGIVGTTTNNSANAGAVGETICAQVTNGGSPTGCATNSNTPISVTSAAAVNVASVSLTAGQWDVCGNVQFNTAGGAAPTLLLAWISTTSTTVPTTMDISHPLTALQATFAAGNQAIPVACTFMKLASTTTVYLEGSVTFSSGTMTAFGYISAVRRR